MVGLCAAALGMPSVSAAAGELETSAWIPFWRSADGVASILPHMEQFTEVNPFMYTVKESGALNQASELTAGEWQELKRTARENNTRFIPTITWSGGESIHRILSDPEERAAHVRAITREVYANDLDGIDIDYEGKFARTNPYFSRFLQELAEAIGYDKWVMCTIESRTPLSSRYSSPEAIPDDIAYANDFSEINKYCDRVRIMAYDQGRFDIKLNTEKGDPYIPVADVDWVEKVMRLAAEEIDKDKLVVGVPTYGYEYDTYLDEDGDMRYSRLWSFNPGYARDVAEQLNIEPTRNNAGELFLTYPASQSPDPTIPLPNATRVMSYSDAGAIADKFALAQELGLRGVAIFKIDGGEDQGIWDVLAGRVVGSSDVTYKAPQTLDPLFKSLETPQFFAMPNRDLEYGARNEDVRTLQQFLNNRGFTVAESGGGSPGNETMFFGPATQSALARFQSSHNVSPAVGYYGPVTRAQIAELQTGK